MSVSVSWKIDLSGCGLVFETVRVLAYAGEQNGAQIIFHLSGDNGQRCAIPLGSEYALR